jgi:hypothetical protein
MRPGLLCQSAAELRAGLHHRDRQVVVDVGVHAGERELNRCARPARVTQLEQWPPRRRRLASGERLVVGAQVEIREHDIDSVHEFEALEPVVTQAKPAPPR